MNDEQRRLVAELAYKKCQAESFPEGREFAHWLEAEAEIRQREPTTTTNEASASSQQP